MTESQVYLTWNYSKSINAYDLNQTIPMNLFWTHAVTDDFSLIWFILPLGFKYQWIRTQNHTLGVQFFNSIGNPDDPSLSPYLTLTDRATLNDGIEIQTELGMQSLILFKESHLNWNFSLLSGPRLQLHPFHVAHFWTGFLRELTPEEKALSFSGGLTYIWSFAAQLDFLLHVSQRITGQRLSSFPDFTGSLGMKYYW
jgi:hypothetical protein